MVMCSVIRAQQGAHEGSAGSLGYSQSLLSAGKNGYEQPFRGLCCKGLYSDFMLL